jgi:hypothetical protein
VRAKTLDGFMSLNLMSARFASVRNVVRGPITIPCGEFVDYCAKNNVRGVQTQLLGAPGGAPHLLASKRPSVSGVCGIVTAPGRAGDHQFGAVKRQTRPCKTAIQNRVPA